MIDTCRDLGIQLAYGKPYRPQGQGSVERLNKTLKVMLKKLIIQRNALYGSTLLFDEVSNLAKYIISNLNIIYNRFICISHTYNLAMNYEEILNRKLSL